MLRICALRRCLSNQHKCPTQGAGLNTLSKVGKYYVKNSIKYNLHTLLQNNIRVL